MRWIIGAGLALFCLTAVGTSAPKTVVNVLDPRVLNILEDSGFSLSEALGGSKTALTADMYKSNQLYRSFAAPLSGRTSW